MKKIKDRYIAFMFGVVFVVVLLILVVFIPEPTTPQFFVFRVVLALAAAGVGAMLPGMLGIKLSSGKNFALRAGGALALFVVVYFFNPGSLAVDRVISEEEYEASLPVFMKNGNNTTEYEVVHWNSETLPNIEDLLSIGPVRKLVIDKIAVTLPIDCRIMAEEIYFRGGSSFTGSEYTVVARLIENGLFYANSDSTNSIDGIDGGSVNLYVKTAINCKIIADGTDGKPGVDGANGDRGPNGGNGRDGNCDGFGRWVKANPGGNGGDGKDGTPGLPGGNGGNGGNVYVFTTRINPGIIASVKGGFGGQGGMGGKGGQGGKGGSGGRGCTGLGGSQESRNNGLAGHDGLDASNGSKGNDGRDGKVDQNTINNKEFISKVEVLWNLST